MIIGIPKEIKEQENRVSQIPSGVSQFVAAGHTVYVEKGAGICSGFSDESYAEEGAVILDSAEEVWKKSDLIYKVKEPLESEYKYFREGLIIFTYFHLAAAPELTEALIKNKVVAIAFETVQDGKELPLLKPMSEVAGRMAVLIGAYYLQNTKGGKGILLPGVPGVSAGKVLILGGGSVGTAAIRIASGLGARVSVLDVDNNRLAELEHMFGNKIVTLHSNKKNIAECIKDADLVISTVLIPGNRAPQLISKEMIKSMEKGSVVVDVAIDQGGTTDITAGHPTTHENPVFVYEGVTFYAVGNIPGAIPRTSTEALANATTGYGLNIANKGWKEAAKSRPDLASGVNIAEGHVTYKGVADALNLKFTPLDELL